MIVTVLSSNLTLKSWSTEISVLYSPVRLIGWAGLGVGVTGVGFEGVTVGTVGRFEGVIGVCGVTVGVDGIDGGTLDVFEGFELFAAWLFWLFLELSTITVGIVALDSVFWLVLVCGFASCHDKDNVILDPFLKIKSLFCLVQESLPLNASK